MPRVQLLNEVALQRTGYATLGVPFPKGELTTNDTLVAIGATSQREKVQWYPQGARWPDNSVRFARCVFKADLGANASKEVDIVKSSVFDTTPGFSIPTSVLNSILNTQFRVTFSPKRPRKVETLVQQIDTPFDTQNSTLRRLRIRFYNDPDPGRTNTAIRITSNIPNYNAYRNPTTSGRRFWRLDRVRYEGQLSATDFYINNDDITSEFGSVSAAATSVGPFNGCYTRLGWEFDPRPPQTLTINLDGSGTYISNALVEGQPSGSSTDVYYRTRYFKRFDDLPDLKLRPLYVELVIDTYRDSKVQKFWFRMGNQLTVYGTGTVGGSYPDQTIFYNGDVILEVTRRNTSTLAPIFYLREESFESYYVDRDANSTKYCILQSNPTSFDTSGFPNLDIFNNTHCIAKKGVLFHDSILTGNEVAELGSDIAAIAMNWDGLYPPYNRIPRLPPWITSRAQGIQYLTNFRDGESARRRPGFPFFMKDIFSSDPSPGEPSSQGGGSGKLGRAFGSFQGYFMFQLAWPALNNLLLWRLRSDFNRPMFYFYEDGSFWDPYNQNKAYMDANVYYRNDSDAHGINAANARDFGGVGTSSTWGYSNFPEGPLMGPLPGSYVKTSREIQYAGGEVPGQGLNVIRTWPKSHWMQQWSLHTAFITMDYHAIEFVKHLNSVWKLCHSQESRLEGAWTALGPPRAVGRPFHMSSMYYALLGDEETFSLGEYFLGGKNVGGSNTPLRGAWYQSAAFKILTDNTNFPAPKEQYVSLLLAGGRADAGRLLATDTYASMWMEGIFCRGLFAWYMTFLSKYETEGAFSAEALRVKELLKYVASSVLLHGYPIDARASGGEEIFVHSTSLENGWKITPFSVQPNIDPLTIPDNSPIFWDCREGDLVTTVEDPTVTGTVGLLYRHDKTNYDKNISSNISNYGIEGYLNTISAPWKFRYEVFIKNKNKNFPERATLRCIRSNEALGEFTKSDNGYMLGYAHHVGWKTEDGGRTYAQDAPGNAYFAPNDGPYWPSGQPLGTGVFAASPKRYVHGPSSSHTILSNRLYIEPLTSGLPRFYRPTANLSAWAWNVAPICKYFLDRGEYHSSYESDIQARISSLVTDEYNKIPQTLNYNFDEDFLPQIDLVDGMLSFDDYFHSPPSFNIGITTLAVTLSGISSEVDYTVQEAFSYGILSYDHTVDTSSQGGGSTSYTHRPAISSIRYTVLPVEFEDFAEVNYTGQVITMSGTVFNPRIFAVIKPNVIDWTRILTMYMEPVQVGGIGVGDQEPGSEEGYLSEDDIIELLGPLGGSDFYNSPNYNGPTEGYYNNDGVNEDTGFDIPAWLNSLEYIHQYMIYEAVEAEEEEIV